MINFHIITLFPEVCEPYLSASILGRAQENKKIKISFYNPRDFVDNKDKRIDQKPYGGGPGMVIEAEPVARAVEKAKGKKKNVGMFFMSASGKEFNNKEAKKIPEKYKHVILIAGRYEGIDQRVIKMTDAKEVSVGPYILTGGELPVMIITDAVSRFVSGVLGNESSLEEGRVSTSKVYTRPDVIKYKGKEYKAPEVLLSGNHKEIEEWKRKNG